MVKNEVPTQTVIEPTYTDRPPLRGFPVYEYVNEPARVEDRPTYTRFMATWLGEDFVRANPEVLNYPYDLALLPLGQLGFAPFFKGVRLRGRRFEATSPHTRAVTANSTGLYEVVARPRRGSAFAAGFDLCAATEVQLPESAHYMQGIIPMQVQDIKYPCVVVVPTGLGLSTVALPEDARTHSTFLGYQYSMPHLEVCSRSGLATQGVSVVNAPGIIDLDYEGEIKVILQFLTGPGPCQENKVKAGMRIAQAKPAAGMPLAYRASDCVSSASRGHGGFGSTGT